MNPGDVIHGDSRITEYDVFLLKQGNHFRLYEKLGSHLEERDGVKGTFFAVWAPNAAAVSVVGDFNGWNPESHRLAVRWDGSGVWEGFIPSVGAAALYKYHLTSLNDSIETQKADPFAFRTETPPRTGSVVWDLAYEWNDQQWMEERSTRNSHKAPFSIYEVHPGSWRRNPNEDLRSLTYRELAAELGDHMSDLGFTHVEFMPIMEHPFFGSWGYQCLAYFAPTARYGSPQDFMFLVDALHQRNVGVILDWVPSHFPGDEHGLVSFDGTHLYEHADPRRGFHPDWNSCIFNYGRNEVRAFLISSARFWLDRYHIDGLRVDAVASMLYLDYSRKEGEWIPNEQGGNENLEAISLLKLLNDEVYRSFPDVQTMAEESTAWPMVSRPTDAGGLGFGMKWNMGWMHDTLEYFSKDPVHRKHHHDQLTFSMMYAFDENFVLSLSHDEVVYEKGSLLNKMPGDRWQKFANLRLLLGCLFAHPGKKLLFMGAELGQWDEWNHDDSLPWHLLEDPDHQAMFRWVKDLNGLYRRTAALHRTDFEPTGFEWIDCEDRENSVISFLRKGTPGDDDDWVAVACNLTPVPRLDYRIGVPSPGPFKELLNSDSAIYGGTGQGRPAADEARPEPHHGRPASISLTLPPLSIVFFRCV